MADDNTIIPTRAKAGWIEVERKDKGGRVIKSRGHVVPSNGMFSGKEMEGVMREVASDLGVSEDRIHIDTYKKGEAPMEANPRHRGWTNLNSRAKKQTEVTAERPIKVRNLFHGWSAPATPEELEQYIQEFNERFKDDDLD